MGRWCTGSRLVVRKTGKSKNISGKGRLDWHCEPFAMAQHPELAAGMKAFLDCGSCGSPLGRPCLLSFVALPNKSRRSNNAVRMWPTGLAGAGRRIHGWPSWGMLADVPERELRECKLGYRAKYLAGVARRLAGELDFEEGSGSPIPEAKDLLMSFQKLGKRWRIVYCSSARGNWPPFRSIPGLSNRWNGCIN